mmetsp:Transcript_31898/g.76474  ORF Transcript_31898/g.76474 Transcript_31898/m.76474 type:complete len:257 (-) Transcript_31898:115-885(-)
MEECHALLVQPEIPSDDDVLLGLGRLLGSIVVSFQLDQGGEHVLVLVGVLVSELDGLEVRLIAVDPPFIQVVQGSIRLLFPKLLELVDLTLTDRKRKKILVLGNVDHPWEEGPVFNQGLPLTLVPGCVLEGAVRQAHSTQNHHHRFRFPGDEPQNENVALRAIVAFQDRVPQPVLRVQLDFLLLGPHQMKHDTAPWETWELRVAEPLPIPAALHHRTGIVGAAVAAGPLRQVRPVEGLIVPVHQPFQITEIQIGCS